MTTLFVGCTRVTDNYVGVRTTYTGEIEEKVLAQGLYQHVIGDVTLIPKRNIVLNVNTQPIVQEKVAMQTFELKVNYGIVSENAAIAYKSEKSQNIITDDGDVYLLGQYVQYVANSAVNDVIAKYRALEVNDNRTKIEDDIKNSINQKLQAQGKAKYVRVNEINILKVIPPTSILDSSMAILKSEQDLKTRKNELEVAKVEQEKMKVLAQQADGQYINLLNAQANLATAEALKIAANKGTLNTTIVVPKDFTSVGNLNK